MTTRVCVFVICLCYCFIDTVQKKTEPLKISNGLIVGRKLRSFQNNIYYAYQQIPYAKPPIGELRFKEAIEPADWNEVLETTKNTKVCVQFEGHDIRESEDCLYLNVYTPADPDSDQQLLPVLFWIHGGTFVKHDGTFKSFGPQYLMDYHVVLVTINYRLGPLGFAYTKDNVIPGNLGLKDQNLALKWVQTNIAYFNGDPKKVTIAGQSAGAAAVGYHLLSPRSKGLFRAAIMESGSPLCSKMFQKHPHYFTYQLGASLEKHFKDCNSTDELLKILLRASVHDLKKKSDIPIPEDKRNSAGSYGNTIWNPVIETDVESGFILHPMEKSFKNGDASNVPIIIGFNSEEQTFFFQEILKIKTHYYDKDDSRLINGNVNINASNRRLAGQEMKSAYTNKTFRSDFGSIVRLMSDIKFTNGISRLADLQSAYSDVYCYQFSYPGLVSGFRKNIKGAGRVGHTEELKYIFVGKSHGMLAWTHTDREVQTKILTLLTNFIKYLNPTPTQDPYSEGVIWNKVRPSNFYYLNIDETLEMRRDPRIYAKWKTVFARYADRVQETF